MNTREQELLKALRKCRNELNRLYYMHLPEYEGKNGLPRLPVINAANKAIAKYKR